MGKTPKVVLEVGRDRALLAGLQRVMEACLSHNPKDRPDASAARQMLEEAREYL